MATETTARQALDRFLSGIELFSDLDDDALQRLAGGFHESAHARDTVIYRHGDVSTALYVVYSGAVAMFRDEVGKPLQLLGRYARGDYFGELGLFDGTRRQATVRVSEPCHLFEISRRQLLEFLHDRPNLTLKLHMAAARRHTENVAAVLGIGGRDDVRIRADRPVLMRGPHGDVRQVILENLSKGGLSLRGAPVLWQPSDSVRFTLELDGHTLEVHGRIAWRHGETLGMAFETRSPEHDDQVQRALRWLIHRETTTATA